MAKKRLDILLVEREIVQSRSRAKALIMAGKVFVDGQRVDKAGTSVAEDTSIELHGDLNPYVSRGGLKLAGALKAFGYEMDGKVVIDVGASTGGFTDCVLQAGATKVYAVDVGYGQIAWKLRQDERVDVIERTNIRHMEPDRLPEKCDLAVIDCSFISLELVLPNTMTFLKEKADVVALIKPQFEVGKGNLGKGGVVRDEDTRQGAISGIIEFAKTLGMERVTSVDSEVHGPKGNIEHLIWLTRVAPPQSDA
ncbi:TlyA family RNA methyltransferase [Bradymonas sediminis]|uniref:TlyA family rRNA (Cytidine-2'-O)-methyltransferase n=1 Tax=Bradymonas sediminis TaxID=1548548 RepID=A0A2Z4FQJ1_9DELT|nr:TlyA family RNA methyltransferase [Bradymonas sediminis]AWV91065.1 TlyA family rRNA (cytidine-2'-O)-methyltransferase [Bradymonas sediminis]TDP75193.1 23S rRNA (cytidine1920-2'-O)/16S rRNA (cytidine1409-2'-O)-methyltransferase [Bradymonas sediminis]